jgi:hypothetical protein
MSDILSAILICWVNNMGGWENVVGRDKLNGGEEKMGKRQKDERFRGTCINDFPGFLVGWHTHTDARTHEFS